MVNTLPASIWTPLAMHCASVGELEPRIVGARFHARDLQPFVVVDLAIGIVRAWLGPNADVPAGASSSDFTVDEVRFQKRVSFAAAGPARRMAATTNGIARFIIPPVGWHEPRARARSLTIMAPGGGQNNVRYAARLARSPRLNSSAPSLIAPKRKAMTSRA